MDFTQSEISKTSQLASGGQSILQVREKVKIILGAIYPTKHKYINEADAIL